jgi:ATP:ADP antiporter, AAA family
MTNQTNSSAISRFIDDVLAFKSRDEVLRCLLAAVCFFCVLSSYYLIRPIREQFASALGGSEALPRLYLIVFLTMLAITPIYGAIVARFSKLTFVPIIYLGFVASFFALKWFTGLGYSLKVNATLVFVYVSIFNLFVVSVFWSCMADSFNKEQAKRLFGFVATGGSAGAIIGPQYLLPFVVKHYGVDTAYLVSAALVMIALICMLGIFWLSRRDQKSHDPETDKAVGGHFIAGAITVFQHPFLRAMMLLMLCGDAIATILYANISDYAKASFATKEAGVLFFARMDTYTNYTTFALQLGVAAIAIKRIGAAKTMSFAYLAVAVLLMGIVLTAEAWVMLVAMVVSRGGTYGVVGPARESMFARVDRESRFKAKNFIDTAVWRFGDVVMVSLVAVLKYFHAGLAVFGGICLCAALLGGWISWRIERYLPK